MKDVFLSLCYLVKDIALVVISMGYEYIKKRTGLVTFSLVIISVIVSLVSSFGREIENINWLFLEDYYIHNGFIYWKEGFSNIIHGQLWRPFTPMFIHFGFEHIFFNMIWLLLLGSQIEKIHGKKFYLMLVLLIALVSNVSQLYVSGPLFGGMSGVVYGGFGYVWIKNWKCPDLGFRMNKVTVKLMIIWFCICLTGLLGNVANTAHFSGAMVGIVFALITSKSQSNVT